MFKLLTVISVLSLVSLNAANAAPAGNKAGNNNNSGGTSEGVGGGSDGCGLGWQVTDKKSMFGTSTRGTTNGFIPPTFGMTSGTIGCDQHSIAKKEQEAAAYAVANYQTLSTELAQGNGETVTGLAYLMGCSSASAQLGQAIKSHYESVGNAQSGIELYRGIRDVVVQDSALSAQCAVVL